MRSASCARRFSGSASSSVFHAATARSSFCNFSVYTVASLGRITPRLAGSSVRVACLSKTAASSSQRFSRSYNFSSSVSASTSLSLASRTLPHSSIDTAAFLSFSVASLATSAQRLPRSAESATRAISCRSTATSRSQSRRFSYICLRKVSASAFPASISRIASNALMASAWFENFSRYRVATRR